MAKFTRTLTRTSSAPIIVNMPKPRRMARVRRAAGSVARRTGRGVRRAAVSTAPEMSLALAGGALGYMQAKGYLNKIPTIGGSRALTIGIAGFAARKFSRNNHVRMIGLCAMVVGAFDFGKIQGGAKSSLEGEDDVDGDDDF